MIRIIKRVEFSDKAKRDYSRTINWYRKQNEVAAIRFRDAVDQAVTRIADDPQRYPFARPGYQFCIVKRFPLRLVFRDEPDRIYVVAVFHGKRHDKHWRRRS